MLKTYGAIINYGNITVENSFFDNATGLRAGIILNYGNLTVTNSEFKNNTAKILWWSYNQLWFCKYC